MSLKALADRVIARNEQRNQRATVTEKARNFGPVSDGEKLRGPESIWCPIDAELSEAVREAFEERVAIREHCGGESREKAEAEARAALRVYEYRLSDYGDNGPWLIFLAPGCDLAEAEKSLKNRFGANRVLTVRERGCG